MWEGVLREGPVQAAREEGHARQEGPREAEPGARVRAVRQEVHPAAGVPAPRQQPPG